MEHNSAIYYSVIASSSISLISCTLLVIALFIVKDFESLSYKLIAYLCITDMLTSIAFLLPSWTSEPLCIAQAFLINYSILSSFFFSSVILHYLKWCIVYEKQQTRSLEIYYAAFAWGLPAVMSSVPLVTKNYGRSGSWCWIVSDNKFHYTLFQIFEGYGIALFIIVYNVYSLVAINKKLMREISLDFDNENIRRKLIRRMIYYPIIIVLCVIPAGFYRIVSLFYDRNLYFEIIAADAQCLMGFGNCIVYGFTDNLKKKLKTRFTGLIDLKEN